MAERKLDVRSISRTNSCKCTFENDIDCKISAVVTIATSYIVGRVFGVVIVLTDTLLRLGSDAGVSYRQLFHTLPDTLRYDK